MAVDTDVANTKGGFRDDVEKTEDGFCGKWGSLGLQQIPRMSLHLASPLIGQLIAHQWRQVVWMIEWINETVLKWWSLVKLKQGNTKSVCFIYRVRNEEWKWSSSFTKQILRNGFSLSLDFTGNIHDGPGPPSLKALNQRKNSAFLLQSLMRIWAKLIKRVDLW